MIVDADVDVDAPGDNPYSSAMQNLGLVDEIAQYAPCMYVFKYICAIGSESTYRSEKDSKTK